MIIGPIGIPLADPANRKFSARTQNLRGKGVGCIGIISNDPARVFRFIKLFIVDCLLILRQRR